ncbi:MAG: CBS domain-containing protein [Chloroflexi bacterium]|nr:CBS domain-containing protein [Chloroflexota bacterium]
MSGGFRIARQTPVSVCQKNLAIDPLLVGLDDDLLGVMRRAAAQPATRLIGVVDSDGRLAGVLPILRLAESVVARVVPESLLGDIADIAGVARFGHAVEARLARDAMLPPAGIEPSATISDAFRLMHQRRLSGLYVVDSDGRPSGYLDLLELAIVYVEAIESSKRPTEPTDRGADTDRADG